MKPLIYMDNGAAEKPSNIALDVFRSVSEDFWGNPNSAHSFGRNSFVLIEESRSVIAKILNCLPDEVHFCSSACEAASWAIKCMSAECGKIVSYPTEHSCVLEAVSAIQPYIRFSVSGKIGFATMLANNETGEIFKIHRGSVLRFVDATAAVGHIPVDFKELGCDYLCGDALKFGGIPGAAFLIIKRGAPVVPLIYGDAYRGGTPPTALICAMAEALKEKAENMQKNVEKAVALRDYMITELLKLPASYLNGPWKEADWSLRLPGNINISFEGVEGTALSLLLSERGLMVSTGSACTSGNNDPSHVLLAMGVPPEIARGTLRITLNENNTMEECRDAVRMISECVTKLRAFSPER